MSPMRRRTQLMFGVSLLHVWCFRLSYSFLFTSTLGHLCYDPFYSRKWGSTVFLLQHDMILSILLKTWQLTVLHHQRIIRWFAVTFCQERVIILYPDHLAGKWGSSHSLMSLHREFVCCSLWWCLHVGVGTHDLKIFRDRANATKCMEWVGCPDCIRGMNS